MKYRCPKCNTIFEGPVKFCPGCGQELKITAKPDENKPLPKKKYKCTRCGAIFEGEVKFCPECGIEISYKKDLPNERVEEEIVMGKKKQKAPVKKYKCPTCNCIYDHPVDVCEHCGTELEFNIEPEKKTESTPKLKESKPDASYEEPIRETRKETISKDFVPEKYPSYEEPITDEKDFEDLNEINEPSSDDLALKQEDIPQDEEMDNENCCSQEGTYDDSSNDIVAPKKKGKALGIIGLIIGIPTFSVALYCSLYFVVMILVLKGITIPNVILKIFTPANLALSKIHTTFDSIIAVIPESSAILTKITSFLPLVEMSSTLFPFVLAGIIIGGIAKKKQGRTGLGNAALCFNILALVFYIIMIIVGFALAIFTIL